MLTDKQREDLKAKHGPDLRLLRAALGDEAIEVVIRRPTKAEYKHFKAMGMDERKRPEALDTLFVSACVYPDQQGLVALLERLPGLSATFGSEVLEFCGAGLEVEKKSL